MKSEQILVRECKDNNPAAQQELYNRYCRKMMGVCLRYSNNKMEAEDILQDGFVKIFRNIDKFKMEGSLEGWVRRIIVNTALENYRKMKKLNEMLDIDEAHDQPFNQEEILSTLHVKELLKVIQKMPVGYRVVFNLFAIEGYSHREIAEQLGITESTSKSQYLRARKHLRKIIQSEIAA